MGKFIDLTGQIFGRLTVIRYSGKNNFGKSMWLCRCECGNEKAVRVSSLTRGDTRSCGCLQKEVVSEFCSNFFSNPNNTETHHQCSTCKQVKSIVQFYKDKSKNRGIDFVCKECRKSYNSLNRNILYFREVKRKYNITKEGFYTLLDQQNYKCSYCNEDLLIDFGEEYHDIAIDHCHNTGTVRGIVHNKCNRSYIGPHDLETARRLVKYLSRFEKNQGENVKNSNPSESVCCSISESESQERYFKGI